MDIKVLGGAIGAILLVLIAAMAMSGPSEPAAPAAPVAPALNVTDLKLVSTGYGGYDIKATIVPSKAFSYLEMQAIAYDKDGAIIEKAPIVWNINDVKAGDVLKVTGMLYVQGSETIDHVDILIYDGAFSAGNEENAIFTQTINV